VRIGAALCAAGRRERKRDWVAGIVRGRTSVNSATGLLLRAEHITRQFGGVVALDDVSIVVDRGEHVALVGDNGAGKSTLVKILTGAEQPDSGSVWFDGRDVWFDSPMGARRAGIETVYQTLALAEELDVVGNLFLGRELVRNHLGPLSVLKHGEMRRDAVNLVGRTGIRIADMRASLRKLSGGQRQGVAIARAVGWGSKLIVMDEPTAALGVRETGEVEDIIRRLKGEGISVLIVSHNLRQVFDLADRVYVMRQGRVAGHGDTRELSQEDVVSMITGVGS
jgi:ABC-type sugar transport system ATPase subunit